jgi:pimeloyl-ACP methyl ester carboxylesterase
LSSHDWTSSAGNVVYERRGLGDPVLLVHGIYVGASHEEFERNIGELSRRFTVYAINLPGFGESDAPRMIYTSKLYHQVLRDFIVEVIGAPTHVVASGVSCGVAVQLAVYDDPLVAKLVLIDPPVEEPPEEGPGVMERMREFLLGTLQMGTGLYETMASRTELKEFLVSRYSSPRHATRRRLEQLYVNANRPNSLHAYVSWMCGHFRVDLFRWLRQVRSETLVIWGADAGEPPADQLARPAAWSRGKRLEVIENTRHWPHDEQSAEVNERILRFLEEQTPAGA